MELSCAGRKVTIPIVVILGMCLIFIFIIHGADGENSPPEVNLISPGSGENVTNPLTMEWDFFDDDDDFVTFDLYLDTDPDPTTLVLNSSSITEFDADTVTRNLTYYWKVVASDGENSTESGIWNFTVVNTPPVVILCHPENPHRSETIYEALVWLAYDYDDDKLLYDVYLDTNSTPVTLIGTTDDYKYFPPALSKGVIYYWRIIATDGYEQTESDIETFSVSQSAKVVPWLNIGYRTYRKTDEKVTSGGAGYGFRMFVNNTLDVSISVSGGNADFYFVKEEEVIKWQWGGRNDTVDSIPIGTKYNCTSISFSFTATESGVYCVIIDDSSMGVAPCVDDPDTYFEETLTTTSSITLDNPVPYIPPPDSDPDPDSNGDSSSLFETVIGTLAAVGCLAGIIIFIVYLLRNESKKPASYTYEGVVIDQQVVPPSPSHSQSMPFQQMPSGSMHIPTAQTPAMHTSRMQSRPMNSQSVPSRQMPAPPPPPPIPAHRLGQVISNDDLPPPSPVDAMMRDTSAPAHPWDPSQPDPSRDGPWMSALSKVVGRPPPPQSPTSSLPPYRMRCIQPDRQQVVTPPPGDRSGASIPDELLPEDPELEGKSEDPE